MRCMPCHAAVARPGRPRVQVEAKKDRSLSRRVQSLSRFLLEALYKEGGAGGWCAGGRAGWLAGLAGWLAGWVPLQIS